MKVSLFSLTGFANEILPALLAIGVRPAILMTRDEPGPFPHYPLEDARPLATRLGIRWSTDPADEQEVLRSDLLLVATYHRKVSRTLIDSCRYAINLHPSLLPRYKGRNPFAAVLEHRERETGITAHGLTRVMDEGPIWGRWPIPIAEGETNGTLRKRLAEVAAKASVDIVQRIKRGEVLCADG